MSNTTQAYFVLKFKTNLGKIASIRIPRANESLSVTLINNNMTALRTNGAVHFGNSGFPTATDSAYILNVSTSELV